jgi:tripartite-type tricarboxylate transporter receptor subunit TctC
MEYGMRKTLLPTALAALAWFALVSLVPLPALAQPYPSRTVTLVCPFAPGGSADIMARLVATKLAEALGATVIVENKAGGGSAAGSAYVAKSKPDGHTLLLITGAYPVQAALTLNPQFDPLRDIAMVSLVTSYPFVINVVADSPYHTLAELIVSARANPGKMNYSSSGVGSTHHLASELFNAMAGTEMVHIPTRGGNVAMTELLAGRIDVLFEAPTLALPFIKSGKLRALAVTSTKSWKALPEVPTVAETLPGYEVSSFIGVGTPAGTPEAVIAQLNRELRRIVDSPDTARRLTELGGMPHSSSPEEMQRYVEQEFRKWRKLIEVRKIERQ